MKKLNVLEWNIRAAASIGWDNDYEIQNWLVDKVTNNKYDVIILNEFAIAKGWDYCQNQLKQAGYVWFMTYTSYENGILIALKKDTFNIECREDVHITKQICNEKDSCIECPDFLAVTVSYANIPLTIIGTRIKVLIGSNDFDEDFKYRKRQFNILCNYLSTLNGRVIVAGDFNNGSIFNESDKNHVYLHCARQHYNYQMIWRKVEDNLNFSLVTPDRGGKYGNTFSIVTIDKTTGKTYFTKEDHIFSNGFKINSCDYLWDFVDSQNGYDNLCEQDYKGNKKYIPDHAILYAELELLDIE